MPSMVHFLLLRYGLCGAPRRVGKVWSDPEVLRRRGTRRSLHGVGVCAAHVGFGGKREVDRPRTPCDADGTRNGPYNQVAMETSTDQQGHLAGGHVLLTGATGFLGQALLERLLSSYPQTRMTLLIRG